LRRRTVLAAGPALVLSACASRGRQGLAETSAERRIEDLLLSASVPAAGLVIRRGGRTVFSHAAGLAQGAADEAEPLLFTPETPMRVASVSKMATALTALRLAESGHIDPDADIRDRFSPALVHPGHPGLPVTLRHLIMHLSGLKDPGVYWMPAPGRTEDLFAGEMWNRAAWAMPGAGFKYCNLGYGLAAHLMEQAAAIRFDELVAREVLRPLAIEAAGFNWSGVPAYRRARGATLYARQDDARWQVRVDGPEILRANGPAILQQEGFSLETYCPGTNGTLFSPQGGLRASLEDIAILARAAAPASMNHVWSYSPVFPNGDTQDGYFNDFGFGVQWHLPERSPVPGVFLIGHHGQAHGLFSAAFHAPELDAEIAFAVTGTSASGAAISSLHPVMVRATEPLWAAAASLLAS
jgi:CubicO group peptidase (beta-lactamase class C family)